MSLFNPFGMKLNNKTYIYNSLYEAIFCIQIIISNRNIKLIES